MSNVWAIRIGIGAIACSPFIIGSPAHAQDVGTSSSGSVTITLFIPPIAPVLAAQQEGAVGAWTVTGRNPGLMVRIPTTAVVGESREMSFFSVNPSIVEVQASPELELVQGKSSDSDGGLGRRNFLVAIKANAARANSAGIIFRAI